MKTILPLSVEGGALSRVEHLAAGAEQAGYDAVSYSEINSDPILHMTVAAGHTKRVHLMTNIIVAFARNPMTLATQATAVQEYSQGRLILGLGSQIKPHIEKRFSMPWSAPAARMTEFISALHAIWTAWETGEKLDFRGEFYSHTLMIPEYAPPVTQPRPKVFLAAVGERMTEAAGSVADGVIVHPFTTQRYLSEITLPALARGREKGNRVSSDVEVAAAPFIICGSSEAEVARSREAVRARVAFYGSTPAYRPVLALHGWGDLGDELNAMSKSADNQRWSRMASLIPDEVLQTFAVEASPSNVGELVDRRFGSLVQWISPNPNGLSEPGALLTVMDAIKSASETPPQ